MQEGKSVRRDFLKSAGTKALGVFVVALLLNAIASTAPALAQVTACVCETGNAKVGELRR